jgi:hypothetical protein
MNEDKHNALGSTIPTQYQSVENRIIWKNKEKFPKQKRGENSKILTFIYCLHATFSLDEPLSKNTAKKVGKAGTIGNRKGNYNKHFRKGVPDHCETTAKIITYLQENPNEICYLTFEFLERCNREVEHKREQFWKKELRARGYNLMCK